MTTFPKRVWLKTDGGWFSREAEPDDHYFNAMVERYLQPGGKLTPEERQALDNYNESLRLEAEPLEIELKALHANALPRGPKQQEKGSDRRSTRSNATISEAYGTGFRQWMRRTFGV